MKPETVTLTVKVVPNASRTEIAGWLGEALKIRLQAPPENGKANQTLIKFLSQKLNCQRKLISIESGEFSPQKRISIEGMSRTEFLHRINVNSFAEDPLKNHS
jgi:uncharacterized protein